MNINELEKDIRLNKTSAVPVAKTYLSGVFGWMFLAMSITAVTSWWFASTPQLLRLLYNPQAGMTILGWIVLLSPIGFVLWMSAGFRRMSAPTLAILFVVYSVLMGMSLSFILLAYTGASIATTFMITAGMFGVMAITGYTTKTDLTKFGSIMFMGLIGIIIAMLVNMFMHSSGLDYIISFLGVLIFTGLTAYDVQKLKRIGAGMVEGAENTRKMTIMGALTLYLDFINLFLFLLRFFGNRR
ncbi:Bax inhibitor-1/YccA family protein [Candidatus Sulfidibacterium hydrothermale]|uniref:Bax inhibitor-1/YccA family protein n=1 Tax=Candidatus Sulfidibacterium hydrothermale TaxID=2875962 RepID=UPI001F0B1C4F|nr:Bax inhibitor-1/YccA family protein [Candidatus Sulfidibacterium hydrothermale]UBM62537.1 Bax inhibitor-1/YccA family protein [Candidatus Sulfidibacterium hydrothermale]